MRDLKLAQNFGRPCEFYLPAQSHANLGLRCVQDKLIAAVADAAARAAARPKVVGLLLHGGPVAAAPLAEYADAVLDLHHPGQTGMQVARPEWPPHVVGGGGKGEALP
jgi:hypothetical protein